MGARLLIAGPSWVGDMVMTQSLLMALRRHDPAADIDILAPAWSMPLIGRMPEARRGVELPVFHGELAWRRRRRLGRELRGEDYHRAIVVSRSFKAALVPWFANVPVRTGYLGEMRYGLINDMRPLDEARLPTMAQRLVALADPAPWPEPPEVPRPHLTVDESRREFLLQNLCGPFDGPTVALVPGAEYGPAKRWPASHFAMLARRLVDAGRRVLILGSAKEKELAGQIRAAAGPGAFDLSGKTSLVDVVDILSACRAAVCNDSGLMHVAAAVGVPLVAVYGSSSPDYTPPLSESARIVRHPVACSPCFRRQCPLGHTNCLTGIPVAEVQSALDGLCRQSMPERPARERAPA